MSKKKSPRLKSPKLKSPKLTNEEINRILEQGMQKRIIQQLPDQSFLMQSYPTSIEIAKGQSFRVAHLRPDSVLVAAIGTAWEPGAWQKVVDMVDHTNKQGICCWYTEIVDNKIEIPYQKLADMRDTACLFAHDQGFEWVLLIENDILPEKDLVLRLIKPGLPIVVPYVTAELERDGKKAEVPLSNPQYKLNQGLRWVKWSVLSCILIWTRVLNCFPLCTPFRAMSVEGDFYNHLLHFGHRAFQDTDTPLKIVTPPTFPADKGSLDGLWEHWKVADKRRRQPPNRKPIELTDTREIYLPPQENIQVQIKSIRRESEEGKQGGNNAKAQTIKT